LTTDGEFHDRHRRLLQAAFTKHRVEQYADLIVQYTQEAVRGWSAGAEIDISDAMSALTLRTTAKIVLDRDLQDSDARQIIEGILAQPVSVFESIVSLQTLLPFGPYRRRIALVGEGDAFIYSVIEQRLADNRDVGDILSILLRPGDEADDGTLSSKETRDELTTLIAAGHETTSNTLVWTLYLLAQSTDALENVRGELNLVLNGRIPQATDLAHLTYLDWAVKESMRLYPAAWVQGRQAVEAFDLDGYHFPAGTLLMFSQWVLHRLPDIWGDPEVFRPERWDPVRGQKAERLAYFPFGRGPRNCLGMPLAHLEVRLVLATILQQFIPALVPGHQVTPLPLITLRPRHGLRLRLNPAPPPVASLVSPPPVAPTVPGGPHAEYGPTPQIGS
jgi:cytochrome P450